MDTAALEAKVRAEYPAFAYLLNVPELRSLLLDAVDPNKGFSAEEFQARFQATNWYRTHGDTQRQWEALVNADPASANRQIDSRIADLRDLIGEMGAPIREDELRWMADWSLRFGIAPGSSEMRDFLASSFDRPGSREAAGGGTFGETLTGIRQLARERYLVGVSEVDAYNWARNVVSGNVPIESVENAIRDLSKGRFGHLADLIDQGVAPGDYFAPYRQLIAEEMEVGSEQVDLLDSRWADVLSYAAPGGKDKNQIRSMTLSETQRFVRQQPEWERTSRARQMSAQLGDQLLRTFGAIA